ncbi:hypothetical protein PilKf_02609 [Pillotina sp. SPG140]
MRTPRVLRGYFSVLIPSTLPPISGIKRLFCIESSFNKYYPTTLNFYSKEENTEYIDCFGISILCLSCTTCTKSVVSQVWTPNLTTGLFKRHVKKTQRITAFCYYILYCVIFISSILFQLF